MDELKRDLNFQIIYTINSVIDERILPSIQNITNSHNSAFREETDRMCSGLGRTTEEKRAKNAWTDNPKPIRVGTNQNEYCRRNSKASHSSDEERDSLHFPR